MIGVLCGLRRGEIVALRWPNVDLDGKQIAVVESAEQTKAGVRIKPPKSGRSRAVAITGYVVDELRAHRAKQAVEFKKLGIKHGDGFVYTREDGEPIQPGSLTGMWKVLVAEAELPKRRFHDLRHAHATHMLTSGVHPKVASERLGHSKVGITLDLYSHVLPGMQEDAVTLLDGAL